MATKPVVIPTWATNANFSAGGVGIIGTPTKVAPSAGVRQDGHIPETAPGAQHENYDRNKIGEWLTYLSDGALEGAHSITYAGGSNALMVDMQNANVVGLYAKMPTSATVPAIWAEGGLDIVPGTVSSPLGFRQRAQAPIALRDTEAYRYCDSAGALTSPTRSGVMVPLVPMSKSAGWGLSAGLDYWEVAGGAAADAIVFDLKIPNGAVVSEVRAGVGRAAGGSGNMELEVFSVAHSTGATPSASAASSLGSNATSGAGGGNDRLEVSGLSYTQGVATQLRVIVRASSSGGVDKLYWLSVSFSDPGPRNF